MFPRLLLLVLSTSFLFACGREPRRPLPTGQAMPTLVRHVDFEPVVIEGEPGTLIDARAESSR